MSGWQEFTGLNRGYVLELYEKYRQNPSSVDDETRALFEHWTPPAQEESPAAAVGTVPLEKVVGAVNLAESIRRYGHLAAKLDPLGGRPPIGDPSLLAATHGVTDEDLRSIPANLVAGPLDGVTTAYDAIDALRRIYCSTTGYDYAHVFVPDEREWLRQAAERGRFRAPADPIDPVKLLDRLSQVEAFERFLQRTFPGKTRFSIEGLDMLVPVLDEVIAESGEAGIGQILDRHGAPRPLERDGARAQQAVRADSRRVQGSGLAQLPRGHGVDGRRQVSRRRAPRDQRWRGDGSRRLDAAQPEPSRGRRSDRRGHGARRRHAAWTAPARPSSTRRAACRS